MPSTGMRFAALVMVFAVWCRGTFGVAATEVELQVFKVAVMAESALGADAGGHRRAFLEMVNKARRVLR